MIACCCLPLLLTLPVLPPTIAATPNQRSIRLSEVVNVTVTVEGEAPLRVAPPANWLTAEKPEAWRLVLARPAGTEAIAPGRERWSQVLLIEPMTTGETVPLPLNPVAVTYGLNNTEATLEIPAITIRVVGLPPGAQPRGAGPILPPPVQEQNRRLDVAPYKALGGVVGGFVILFVLWRDKKKQARSGNSVSTLDELVNETHSSESFAEGLRAFAYVKLREADPTGAPLRPESAFPRPMLDVLKRCEDAIYGRAEIPVDERRAMTATVRNHFASAPLDPPTDAGKTS